MASEKVCKLILKEDYFVSPKSGSVQESSQFPLFQESTSSICVIPDGIIHFQSKSTSKPRESSDYVTGGVDINSPISCLTVRNFYNFHQNKSINIMLSRYPHWEQYADFLTLVPTTLKHGI